jgi:hypothetical protein
LAGIVERNNVFLTEAEVCSIRTYIKRLRPNSEAIGRSLAGIRTSGPDHVQRFLIAAKEVIEADGVLHTAEMDLINDIARELIGVGLT